jgi:hypothetical protein
MPLAAPLINATFSSTRPMTGQAPERLRILERLEKLARRLPVPGHALINQLTAQQSKRQETGGAARNIWPISLASTF